MFVLMLLGSVLTMIGMFMVLRSIPATRCSWRSLRDELTAWIKDPHGWGGILCLLLGTLIAFLSFPIF